MQYKHYVNLGMQAVAKSLMFMVYTTLKVEVVCQGILIKVRYLPPCLFL